MNGEHVGTWRAGRGRDELQYAESWLASPNSRPISLRFPLRPGAAPYTGLTSTTSVALTQTSGARFGPDFKPADVQRVDWGKADLRWTDCQTLHIDYTRKDGVHGNLSLNRIFASARALDCQ